MSLLLYFAGFFHAPSTPAFSMGALCSMISLYLLVSGASVLNMAIEIKQDALMERTKNRPLPAGRITLVLGVIVGCSLSLLALLGFFWQANLLTFYLGIFALLSYALIYTLLKRVTWFSLVIGAVPGAMPVVLGYTAAGASLDSRTLALFLWAFLWQIPHFLAISIFRENEYTKAGFKVFPQKYGLLAARFFVVISSWLLVFCTGFLYLTNAICVFSFVCSLLLGGWFLWVNHRGFMTQSATVWAKKTFRASLAYQGFLFLILSFEPFLSW